MTARGRHLAALCLGAALLTSAGCGSSDERKGEPLPQASAAAIAQRLDEVQRRFESATTESNPGACADIENDSYKAIDAVVRDLPAAVDADVREALEESLARLKDLTDEGCSEVKAPPRQDTTPEETAPPPPEPLPTETEQTDTEQTVPDVTKPKKDKPRKGKGKGKGNGNDTQPGGTGTQPGSGAGGQPAPQAEG